MNNQEQHKQCEQDREKNQSRVATTCDECKQALSVCECHELTDEEYEDVLEGIFIHQLDQHRERLLARFRAGRKKYKNKLEEIDFPAEIQQEVDDIVIYNLMKDIKI